MRTWKPSKRALLTWFGPLVLPPQALLPIVAATTTTTTTATTTAIRAASAITATSVRHRNCDMVPDDGDTELLIRCFYVGWL